MIPLQNSKAPTCRNASRGLFWNYIVISEFWYKEVTLQLSCDSLAVPLRPVNRLRFWRRLGIAHANMALLSACTELHRQTKEYELWQTRLRVRTSLARVSTMSSTST